MRSSFGSSCEVSGMICSTYINFDNFFPPSRRTPHPVPGVIPTPAAHSLVSPGLTVSSCLFYRGTAVLFDQHPLPLWFLPEEDCLSIDIPVQGVHRNLLEDDGTKALAPRLYTRSPQNYPQPWRIKSQPTSHLRSDSHIPQSDMYRAHESPPRPRRRTTQ